MNKSRLEALSDATFAIVFTLLVIEIRVPEHLADMSSAGLWHALQELSPLFAGYVITGLVLTMLWTTHSFFYGFVVKNINRQLAGLNMLYLGLVSLIPFSAHMLGRYGEVKLAVALYGLHVLVIGLVIMAIFEYAMRSNEIDTSHNESRLLKQARVRMYLTPSCTALGIVAALLGWFPLALTLYIFPVLFNVIPGLLNKAERMFGFRLS